MLTVYIMRHGETDLNRENRLQGQIDCPLNETGKEQARLAGERFRARGLRFDKVYASTLTRAVQTAALAAGVPEDFVRRDPRLMELDYGPYDAAAFTDLGPEMFAWFRDPEGITPPAGIEPISALLDRTRAFLESLKAAGGGSVLVVTHGVAIRAMLGHLMRKGAAVWGMPIDNCVLYETQLTNGTYTEPKQVEA